MSALRPAIAALCVLGLCGFAQVQDRVVVQGDGGARVERRVVFQDWMRWPALAAPESERARRLQRSRDDTRARICETAREAGWDDCAMDADGLRLAFSVGSDSPFSGSTQGTAYLAVDRLLGDSRLRPMFQPALLGLDSDQDRRTMGALRALGYRHSLEITMPGEVRDILGTQVDARGDSIRFDLMADMPPPEYVPDADGNNFIHASAGLLHGRWTALLVLGALGLALLYGIRRLRD